MINRVESVNISFVHANDFFLLDDNGVQFVLDFLVLYLASYLANFVLGYLVKCW